MTSRWVLLLLLVAAGCRKGEMPVPLAGPRLVSLAPNLTEMVYAVGAGSNLVGRTSACDFPPEVASVQVVGGYGDPSFEMLLSLQPDHIVYVDLMNKDFAERLKERGLDARLIPCLRLADIPVAVEEIGRLAGRPLEGQAVATRLRGEIERARAAAEQDTRPRVFVALWDDPFYTVGQGSFVSELVELAGGRNIGDEVDSPYFAASPEWVIARDPEVVLCLFMSDAGDVASRVSSRPALASLSAVRNGRVHAGFNNAELLRPGPRVMRSVETLRRCLHPETGKASP